MRSTLLCETQFWCAEFVHLTMSGDSLSCGCSGWRPCRLLVAGAASHQGGVTTAPPAASAMVLPGLVLDPTVTLVMSFCAMASKERITNDALTPHATPGSAPTVAESLVALFNAAFNGTPIDLGTLTLPRRRTKRPALPATTSRCANEGACRAR